MDLTTMTFEEGMRVVAERRLFAQMRKEADGEAARSAQGARQTLGVLGADEGVLNSALTKLRGGKIGPWRASSQMHGAVPGAGQQIVNLPGAVGTAAQQGRPSDAAAQLDVLGLKQLSPWAENASPTTAAASLGLGVGAYGLQEKVRKEKGLWDVLHGRGAATGANDVLAKEPGVHAQALTKWRAANTPTEHPWAGAAKRIWNAGRAPQPPDRQGLGWRLTHAQGQLNRELPGLRVGAPIGLPEVAETTRATAKIPAKSFAKLEQILLKDKGQSALNNLAKKNKLPGLTDLLGKAQSQLGKAQQTQKTKVVHQPTTLTRDMIANAHSKLPMTAMGRAATIGLPMAAASLPLLYREWLSGRGYRSGHQPIQRLVESAQEKKP